jgi:hypothetical protein
VFGLSKLEHGMLEAGNSPPSWKCKCLGGKPGEVSIALVHIEKEKPS